MGNTNEIATAVAKSQALAQELEKDQSQLQHNFESGDISAAAFLGDTILNIHRTYCATNGLPYGETEKG